MKFFKSLLLLIGALYAVNSYAQQENITPGQGIKIEDAAASSCDASCTCDHNGTPVGVTTDHVHPKGTWVFSYTYMNTMMQGNNIGAAKASDNTVYKNYMMAPETMSMQMHMLMAMYGVTDKLTLMAMGGYMVNNMSMNMSDAMMNMPGMVMTPGNMTMQSMSSGFTDTKVSALYNFSNQARQRIIGSIGVSLPTGSIKETGTTILGDNQRLPYDMQTGSGSFSIDPDITYARKNGLFYWGANAGADVKLNYNSLGYKDGNLYHATAWAGYQFLPFLTGTLRAEGVHTNTISGADPIIAAAIYQETDPTTRTANYGGSVVNAYIGLNFHLMKPVLERFRIMAEYGMPVYQNLDGTQIALKANVLAGLQYSF